jgi:hypothetical protein
MAASQPQDNNASDKQGSGSQNAKRSLQLSVLTSKATIVMIGCQHVSSI